MGHSPARPGQLQDTGHRTKDTGHRTQDTLSPRTSLRSGSSVNVSWSLAYAHGGGYRLTLVSPGEWEEGGRFSRSHLVTLPQGVQCTDCYLKLERQATEWGKNYIFR